MSQVRALDVRLGGLVSTSSLSQFRAWTSPISWDYCKIACDWEDVSPGISKSGFVGHFNIPNLTSLGRGVSFIRRGTALERNFKSSGVTVDCVNDIEL